MQFLSSGRSSTLHSCVVALVGLVEVCLLSRMSMSESTLGAYGRDQMLRTVRRIISDADAQAEMSHQDADPLVAMLHNIEASANLKAARRLAEESRVSHLCKQDFVGTLAELAEEQGELIQALTNGLGLSP